MTTRKKIVTQSKTAVKKHVIGSIYRYEGEYYELYKLHGSVGTFYVLDKSLKRVKPAFYWITGDRTVISRAILKDGTLVKR